MLKQSAVALGLTVVLAGCSTLNPDKLCLPDQAVSIPDAAVPTKSSADRKVIVLPVDFEFKDSAQKKLQSVIRNSLESQVESTGAHLVDRKLADKLKGEIKLAEQSGRYNKKGVPIADLAVLTEVTSSDLSYSHAEAYTWEDKKGKKHHVPAKCSYKVEVNAIAKVVTLPEMSLVKRIELSGNQHLTTESRKSDCPISNAAYEGLASKAAAEAVEYNPQIKNLFAATAPVLELRQCEVGSMVKIGVGSDKKVAPRSTVAFSKIMKNSEGELETFAVGEGKVVNIPDHGIKPKYSWVAIEEETALKIQKGDAAKVIPETCKNGIIDLKCTFINM